MVLGSTVDIVFISIPVVVVVVEWSSLRQCILLVNLNVVDFSIIALMDNVYSTVRILYVL